MSECFTSIKQLMPYADVHFVSVKIEADLLSKNEKRKAKNEKRKAKSEKRKTKKILSLTK